MEFLETKSISSEANSSWDEINSILDITEEILCKVKEMEIETFQIESEKKRLNVKWKEHQCLVEQHTVV